MMIKDISIFLLPGLYRYHLSEKETPMTDRQPFHAIICIKQVPDTTNIRIDPETGNLIRQGVPTILNPYDAHAVSAAVEWKRRLGGRVTVITMGPPAAAAALRECIELGADRGILLTDRAFSGADTLATSYVLGEAIKAVNSQQPVDLVLFGKQAIDGDTAQVGPGVSVRLEMPLVTYAVQLQEIDLDGRCIIVERKTEHGNELLNVHLPAVITCEKEVAEIPFASLPDLLASLEYEPELWTATSPVPFEAGQIGIKGSPTTVYKTGTPEKHMRGEILEVSQAGLAPCIQSILERITSARVVESLKAGAV